MGRDSLYRRTILKLLGAGGAAAASGTAPAAAVGADQPTGGDDAYWTTGEQYGVGTVADHGADDPSRVWFTLSEGAMTGARFPRIDLLHLRTLEFVVADAADDAGYAVRTYDDSRRDDDSSSVERRTRPVDSDALLFEQRVADSGGDRDWRLDVEYVAHPDHDAVLLDVTFEADDGRAYDVYALADPSLSNSGRADEARAQPYRSSPGKDEGRAADAAERQVYALTGWDTSENDGEAVVRGPEGDPYNVATALVSDDGFEWATVDVVGGDALSSLLGSGDVPTTYERAEGNVAMVGRVASASDRASDTLALGFADDNELNEDDVEGAFETARAALRDPYDRTRGRYVKSWREYLDGVEVPEAARRRYDRWRQYRMAAMVLRAADSKQFPGAGIASPSVPWGGAVKANSPSDYGYNYVWARDLYQAYTAMLAMGDVEGAKRAVEYLYEYQQRDDGFLPQNTFVDGTTRWGGEQMDEISFPQLMAYQLRERHGVGFDEASYSYDNVRKSADYVVANGPETGQDRWEEESGVSPATTAAEVASLVAAAELAAAEGERGDALAYIGVADRWQARTEEWMATETGTTDHDNTPYYVRINDDRDPDDGATVELNNGGPTLDERSVIDGGFLELVRLGVKPWDDPVIRNSLREVDDAIRVDTPHGPAWYRYNGDGYGEQAENPDDDYTEGAPWALDDAGKGRLWPIFSGERGEYELLAGTDRDSPTAPGELLDAMVGFANSGLMIPEQVWDQEDPTPFGWEFGEGTGSATPLSWSMAQYVRLAHSLDAGEPVERPAVTAERYVFDSPPEGPSLDVSFSDSAADNATVTVSGTTDGDEVVAKSPAETVYRKVEGGSFELELDGTDGSDGDAALTVVAATGGDDLSSVGATVRRQA